jgi:NTP pyrophosphatase (non-canonical NTP hydrolase)
MGRNQSKIFTTGREIITMSEGQLELELGTVTNENHKYKKISDLDMYQKVALTTAIYPREQAIIYPTLGLTGEAGEVANKVKKIIRDGSDSKDEKLVSEIKSEIGDCLWYIAVLANDFNIKLSDIASANIEKLATRKSKGTIHGSGDNR